jgi:SAM-dependent MidA family methyltransferase
MYYVNSANRFFCRESSKITENIEGEQKMKEIIIEMIRQTPEHMIPFRVYMEAALYHPAGGYYQQPRLKIGKQGDFYTNASVGAVYGEVLADVIWEMVGNISYGGKRAIVEMGGGHGQLSTRILQYLCDKYEPARETIVYIMIEKSEYHRRIQEEALRSFHDKIEICWYESIAQAKRDFPQVRGVLFSNELPDAFPVHLIEYRDGAWHEIYVTIDEDNRVLKEVLGCVAPDVAEYIVREKIPPLEGYRTEVNIESVYWMRDVAEWLGEGYVMTVDYGYERERLYAPSRRQGTLLCYRNHTVSEDPYRSPGQVDITSHVNFSALMDVGEKAGLETIGFYTQQQFLMQAGILTRLQEHGGGDPFMNGAAKRNRAIRQLILSEGMGQAFRVLLQGKGVSSHLTCCSPWHINQGNGF